MTKPVNKKAERVAKLLVHLKKYKVPEDVCDMLAYEINELLICATHTTSSRQEKRKAQKPHQLRRVA